MNNRMCICPWTKLDRFHYSYTESFHSNKGHIFVDKELIRCHLKTNVDQLCLIWSIMRKTLSLLWHWKKKIGDVNNNLFAICGGPEHRAIPKRRIYSISQRYSTWFDTNLVQHNLFWSMTITNPNDNHNTMDFHPMHLNRTFIEWFFYLSSTYTCDNDVKSLNDPSGIVDMSLPCKDLQSSSCLISNSTSTNLQNTQILQSFESSWIDTTNFVIGQNQRF